MKQDTQSHKIQLSILVLLGISIALNVYLYFGMIHYPQEHATETGWILGGTDSKMLHMAAKPSKMLVSSWERFNVSVCGYYWDPFSGNRSYNFYYKLYERPLGQIAAGYDPPTTPTAVMLVSEYKEEWELTDYIPGFNWTVKAPLVNPENRISIYRVVMGDNNETLTYGNYRGIVEFAITIMM